MSQAVAMRLEQCVEITLVIGYNPNKEELDRGAADSALGPRIVVPTPEKTLYLQSLRKLNDEKKFPIEVLKFRSLTVERPGSVRIFSGEDGLRDVLEYLKDRKNWN